MDLIVNSKRIGAKLSQQDQDFNLSSTLDRYFNYMDVEMMSTSFKRFKCTCMN